MKDTIFLVNIVFEAAQMITDDFFVASKDEKGDLVTSFDFEIEGFISDKIRQNYPTFDIIGEEFNPAQKQTPNCFVIDPVDGTINFAHGLPLWGIQVAMIKRGRTVCSVIYLPKLHELYFADSRGAFVMDGLDWDNAKQIHVSDRKSNKALYLVEGGNKFPALEKMESYSRNWRFFSCSAVNYAWTACGRLGGTILRKDYLWDYLPGQYLVKQAGGFIHNKKGAHVAANSKELAHLLLTDGSLA